jgi:hypothetical protein
VREDSGRETARIGWLRVLDDTWKTLRYIFSHFCFSSAFQVTVGKENKPPKPKIN